MPITLNGTDLTTLGFVLADPPGWLDDPARRRPAAAVAGRAGAIPFGVAEEQPRKIALRGVVRGATAPACRDNLDRLSALLHAPVLSLAFSDLPGVAIVVELDGAPTVRPAAAPLAARVFSVEIPLVANDPYFYDLAATTVTLTAAPTSCPVGTAPVGPVVTIQGAATNPALTLRTSDGAVVQTLGLVISCVAGDVLVIDCAAATIRKNGVSAIAALTSGDFVALDVASQGRFADAAWPTLACAGLAGGSAAAAYQRAWR